MNYLLDISQPNSLNLSRMLHDLKLDDTVDSFETLFVTKHLDRWCHHHQAFNNVARSRGNSDA